MCYEYIFKSNDKYTIKRNFNGIEYEFGNCDSFKEAKLLIKQLDKDGWPLNTKKIISDSKELVPNSKNNLNFNIKVGKAYKHGFLVLTRKECYDLFPKISYEDECDIILDDIKSKARLNFVPRLVIDRKNEVLINHLKELSSIDPTQRRYVTLVKQDPPNQTNKDFKSLLEENKKLKEKINIMEKKIEELYNLTKK